jgi:hypothetical protein
MFLSLDAISWWITPRLQDAIVRAIYARPVKLEVRLCGKSVKLRPDYVPEWLRTLGSPQCQFRLNWALKDWPIHIDLQARFRRNRGRVGRLMSI